MLSEPTNEQRAAYAGIGLDAYLEARGDSDDAESNLIDFLTDLLHYAKENGLKGEECVTMAQIHFEAEGR